MYYVIMKKILLIFLLIIFTTQAAYCLTARKEAFNKMQKDNSDFYQKCSKLAKNFQYDNKFFLYMNSSCMEFEYDRKRLVESIYPKNVDYIPNYINNYQTYRTNYSIELNKNKFKSYEPIINEYCKIHAKYSINAKNACQKAEEMF